MLQAVMDGLGERPYTLPAWLFYDERGSELFEEITRLPEYYLTRTERNILQRHADGMLSAAAGDQLRQISILELGAGTATKTGVLLRAAARRQGRVRYAPVDVSPTALEEAERLLRASIPGLTVTSQVANYLVEPLSIDRPADGIVLALYIGSSIGNFHPVEARDLLRHLRFQLLPGDALLLGTDLAPAGGKHGMAESGKSAAMLLAAYDDAAGVTAAFNKNMLVRLNRELGADFALDRFTHQARWNAGASRIEMHLVSEDDAHVTIPIAGGDPLRLRMRAGESIHTENSYKYTRQSVRELLASGGFAAERDWTDENGLFAVTLARVI